MFIVVLHRLLAERTPSDVLLVPPSTMAAITWSSLGRRGRGASRAGARSIWRSVFSKSSMRSSRPGFSGRPRTRRASRWPIRQHDPARASLCLPVLRARCRSEQNRPDVIAVSAALQLQPVHARHRQVEQRDVGLSSWLAAPPRPVGGLAMTAKRFIQKPAQAVAPSGGRRQ
jgi:hypothetical protein